MKHARTEEIDEFRQHGVRVQVPIQECMQETGRMPIGCRCVDVNKGGDVTANYRSRSVARLIRHKGTDSIFVPAPPLEAM